MVERQIILPASRDDVWAALTEPDQLAAWFGAEVEWDLRPGGRAAFGGAPGDPGARVGVISTVRPGRTLRFRWWPADGGAGSGDTGGGDTGGGDAAGARVDGRGRRPEPPSEVTYTLEDDPEGTLLIVTEEPLASAMSGPTGLGASTWDGRTIGLWLHLSAPQLVCA